MGLTGLHDSYGSWYFYICRFLFGLSTIFCCFTGVYEEHFMLCYKEELLLDRAMANFKTL